MGGAAIYWLDWTWVDPILTLIIAGYILWMSWGLLFKASGILMEGVPEDLDLTAIKTEVESLEGVSEMYHIHAWELSEGRNALEAQILLAEGSKLEEVEMLKSRIKKRLADEFHIAHLTLELGLERTESGECF
jgi:cobalt-zinc-cadmium efflux system protein